MTSNSVNFCARSNLFTSTKPSFRKDTSDQEIFPAFSKEDIIIKAPGSFLISSPKIKRSPSCWSFSKLWTIWRRTVLQARWRYSMMVLFVCDDMAVSTQTGGESEWEHSVLLYLGILIYYEQGNSLTSSRVIMCSVWLAPDLGHLVRQPWERGC